MSHPNIPQFTVLAVAIKFHVVFNGQEYKFLTKAGRVAWLRNVVGETRGYPKGRPRGKRKVKKVVPKIRAYRPNSRRFFSYDQDIQRTEYEMAFAVEQKSPLELLMEKEEAGLCAC